MKNEYITPLTNVVNIHLTGSVLGNTTGVDNGSRHSFWEYGAKKYHGIEDTESEMPDDTEDTHKSIWDD
jgi:hypothetical protein